MTTPPTTQRLIVRENHGDKPCIDPAAMMELRLRLAGRDADTKPRSRFTRFLCTLTQRIK